MKIFQEIREREREREGEIKKKINIRREKKKSHLIQTKPGNIEKKIAGVVRPRHLPTGLSNACHRRPIAITKFNINISQGQEVMGQQMALDADAPGGWVEQEVEQGGGRRMDRRPG